MSVQERVAEQLDEQLAGKPRLASVVEVVKEMAREFKADRVTGLAAEVAYFGILALFPALLALAAFLGQLESLVGAEAANDARRAVVDGLADVLGSTDSGPIEVVESLFETQSPGLLTFGLLGALFAVSRGLSAIIKALDEVYDLEEGRSALKLRATALGLSLGSVMIGAIVLVLLVVGPLFGQGGEIADELGVGGAFEFLWNVMRVPVAFLALVGWASLLFHVAPNHHTPWRYDVPGALLSAVGWVAVAFGFRYYLELTGSGNEVYGAIGGALGLLLFLYFIGMVLLIGGELNAVLSQRAGVSPGGEGRDEFELPDDEEAPALRALLARK